MNSKIKIYFPGSWGLTSPHLTNLYKSLSPGNSGIWENLEIVNNLEECDYVIVQDKPEEIIPENKKVIFFGREPKYIEDHSYEGKNLHLSFHHTKGESWLPQTWWLNLNYDELVNLEYPKKNKLLSIIDSGKQYVEGHRIRLKTIQQIVRELPSHVEVFGHITNGMQFTPPFVSPLPPRSKEKGLLDYRYNLAFENGQTDFYFSEKIIDPILCWATPIYWGCKKIDKFLPKGSYVNLDPTKSGIIREIKLLLESNYHEDNKEALKEARELILKKYNLLPTIKRALDFKKIL